MLCYVGKHNYGYVSQYAVSDQDLLCHNCILCVDNHIKLYESSQLIKSPCLEMIPAPTWREGLVLGPHSAPEGRSGPSSLQSGKGEARHH